MGELDWVLLTIRKEGVHGADEVAADGQVGRGPGHLEEQETAESGIGSFDGLQLGPVQLHRWTRSTS